MGQRARDPAWAGTVATTVAVALWGLSNVLIKHLSSDGLTLALDRLWIGAATYAAAHLLLGGSELVQDAGQWFGGVVEPVADQGCLAGNDLDDRAPPVGRVGAPLHEARPVQLSEHATDRGQRQAQPRGSRRRSL